MANKRNLKLPRTRSLKKSILERCAKMRAKKKGAKKQIDQNLEDSSITKTGISKTTESDTSAAGSSTVSNSKKVAEEAANTDYDLSAFHKPILIEEADLNGCLVGVIKQEVWEFQEPE